MRYERQIRIFGRDGQMNIERTHVAICGVGGLGSHVCQQLAYLGVKKFTLIDSDVVEESNLNRLIGGFQSNVGVPKVDAVRTLILDISPSATVRNIYDSIRAAQKELANASIDVLVGCVDNDLARLHLIDVASQKRIPYLDLASEIHPAYRVVGGQVFLSNGEGCLLCTGMIDQHEVRMLTASKAESEFHKQIYGVDESHLADSGPSVVSLNGLVASLGMCELQILLAGLPNPTTCIVVQRRQSFNRWTTSYPEIAGSKDCYYCNRYQSAA